MLLSNLSCTILIITVILLNKYECSRSVYSALSNIAKMMSLLYPKVTWNGYVASKTKPLVIFSKDCGSSSI